APLTSTPTTMLRPLVAASRALLAIPIPPTPRHYCAARSAAQARFGRCDVVRRPLSLGIWWRHAAVVQALGGYANAAIALRGRPVRRRSRLSDSGSVGRGTIVPCRPEGCGRRCAG